MRAVEYSAALFLQSSSCYGKAVAISNLRRIIMKPGNGLYASGESMEREEEKMSVLTPIALGLAAVAAIALGAAARGLL